MNLQALLGDLSLSQFVADYYQRLPYSAAALAQPLCGLGTWEALAAIIAQEQADVLVCRQNERYQGPPPCTEQEAARLIGEGFTLLVRHAERHDERLARLAGEFAADFAAPVNIHMYATPAGQFGFGWHYDAEEVFIVQTAGRKEYSLRKNTVNPWPIEESLPANMRYEREIMPLARCELAAGDWLYIPSGYWHMAASRELAHSLAIGVQPRTGIDALDFLRRRLLDSLLWRQRLPVAGRAAALDEQELAEAHQKLLGSLARDLQAQLADPKFAAQLISHLRVETKGNA
ncbi:MAG: cupin domain-containing protein [Planctomycetaceae bacterium]|nr:cupin domain-containing protein [Planctomycetaceae bacterium]